MCIIKVVVGGGVVLDYIMLKGVSNILSTQGAELLCLIVLDCTGLPNKVASECIIYITVYCCNCTLTL